MMNEEEINHLSTSASSLNYYHEDEEKPPLELSTSSYSASKQKKQQQASSSSSGKNGINSIQRNRRGSATSTSSSSVGDGSKSHVLNMKRHEHGGDAFLPTSFHSSLRTNHMHHNITANPNHPGATMKNRFKVHMRQSIPFNASSFAHRNKSNYDLEREEMLRVTTNGHFSSTNSQKHNDDYDDDEYSDDEETNDERHSLLPSSEHDNGDAGTDPVLIWNFIWIDAWDFILSVLNIKGPRRSRKMSAQQRNAVMRWKRIGLALLMLYFAFVAVMNVTNSNVGRFEDKIKKKETKSIVIHEREKVDDDVADLFPSQSKLQSVNPKRDNAKDSGKATDDDFYGGKEDVMIKEFHQQQEQKQQKRPSSVEEELIFSTKKTDIKAVTNNNVKASPLEDTQAGTGHVKVLYFLTIDSCYPKEENMLSPSVPLSDAQFHDAAIVLKQSIHDNSIQNATSNSKYDYEMVALMHQDVIECEMHLKTTSSSLALPGGNRKELLESLGYTVHLVSSPIDAKEISQQTTADFYRYAMVNKDIMREFITLKAFSFEHAPLAVLVELTTMVLKPPDDLFDLMLQTDKHKHFMNKNDANTYEMIVKQTAFPNGNSKQITDLPSTIDVLYTKDYSAVAPKQWVAGLSLNFLVFKPSVKLYMELLQTLRSGHFTDAHGWGALGYKSRKVRGLFTYFFQEKKFQQSIEVHRCTYNNRAENPTINLNGRKMCRDVNEKNFPTDKCTDCRQTSLQDIVIANTATCMAPWRCNYPIAFTIEHEKQNKGYSDMKKLCRSYNEKWYQYRQEYELQHSDKFTTANPGGGFRHAHFQGYCARESIYLPMRLKDSKSVAH